MQKRQSVRESGFRRRALKRPVLATHKRMDVFMGIAFVMIIVLNLGCHRSEAEGVRRRLIEAEALIQSAKMIGAGDTASSDIEIAEDYYKQALAEIREARGLDRLIADAQPIEAAPDSASLAKQKAQDVMEKMKIQNEALKISNQALREKLESIRHTIQSIQTSFEAYEPGGDVAITPEIIYNNAFHQFEQNDFPSALASFQSFLELFPDHDLSDNAQYWIGECHYSIREYRDALMAFSMVLEKYPGGNKAPDALLKIGLCHKYIGNPDEFSQRLNRTIRDYPDSNAAKIAQKLLNQSE